jgi:hypothetical protein
VKRSRQLISEHASWFRLRNYESLETATPRVWFTQFALRIDLQRMRSLLIGPDDPSVQVLRSGHDGAVALVRSKGVIKGLALAKLLQYDEALSPEGFSTLGMANANGVYLRPMSLEDFFRVGDALNAIPPSGPTANDPAGRSGGGLYRSSAKHSPSLDLSDSLDLHVRRSLVNLYETFVTVDLRLPRALLIKQFAEVIDMQRKTLEPLLPPARQTKMPSGEAWAKSQVLPYIDLCQWRDELKDNEIRSRISDADIASILEIDPKTLSETTKNHADALTNPLSWVFMHLVEAASSGHRIPLTPLRKQERRRRNTPKN